MSDWTDRLHMIGEWFQYPRIFFGLLITSFGGTPYERIRFGAHRRQYLIAIDPQPPTRRVAVFFLHGGGWRQGKPEFFEGVGRFFSRRGIAVGLPAYRLAPKHKHPAQVNDAAAAFSEFIRWLDEQGLSDIPIVVGGNSAGAHIAAFFALDPRFCDLPGHDRIRGVLSMAGPLRWDVEYPVATRKMMRDLLRKVNAWPEADPYLLVQKPQTRRLLVLQGGWDPLISVKAAEDYASSWSPDGSHSEIHIVPRHFHSDICCDAFLKPCKERRWIHDFIDRIEAEGLPAPEEAHTDCMDSPEDDGLPLVMRKERPNPYLEDDE